MSRVLSVPLSSALGPVSTLSNITARFPHSNTPVRDMMLTAGAALLSSDQPGHASCGNFNRVDLNTVFISFEIWNLEYVSWWEE